MNTIIEFEKVSKVFGKNYALRECSFTIGAGQICGVIGPSGAGKSTLLKLLVGLYKPSSGKVLINNKNVSKKIKELKKNVGFAVQERSFYDELTTLENLYYFGRIYKVNEKKLKKISKNVLELVELWPFRNILAGHLSGGMQRRVDMACSLVHSPKILIMDEPTTGLDPLLRKRLLLLIQKINKMGVTIIISTHLLNEIEHLCNKIVMLKDGKVIAQGTPEKIKNMYSVNEEIHLETFPGKYDKLLRKIGNDPNISNHKIKGHKLILYTRSPEKTLHKVLHLLEKLNEKLIDVDVDKPSLSEVFEYFEEEKNDS